MSPDGVSETHAALHDESHPAYWPPKHFPFASIWENGSNEFLFHSLGNAFILMGRGRRGQAPSSIPTRADRDRIGDPPSPPARLIPGPFYFSGLTFRGGCRLASSALISSRNCAARS